ncbi:MAG TPA: methylmalonyl-CoA mutase subunit beta [Flavobacterium sp.]|jgi:methylmalonyl-CoA mutase
MAKQLFDEFQPVSSKQWKQQIQFELKGADYNEVVWHSPEDIKVKPFYHYDETETPLPLQQKKESFRICQDIFVRDVAKSAHRAIDSITRGAESIRFTIPDQSTDMLALFENIPLENVTIYLELQFLSTDFIMLVDKIATVRHAKIFCCIDPVGQLAKDGNWFASAAKDNFTVLKGLASELKTVSIISVNSALYQNAGANIVQQLAYSLAHAAEYFNRIESIKKPVVFQVAIGSNYFFEIAKLRALRILFELVATEFGHDLPCHIIATPSKRNKTLYDYNVNLLRTTTECMSAILGGADAISNLPYDTLYHKSNEFGERISRNQLLVLKHESYFDKVGNAPDGSYYVENLTQQLAEKALTLFKDIEANGGFIFQLGDGTIQRKIKESAEKEQQLFDSGKEVLLGTNKHPNPTDLMAADLELFPFVKTNSRKTLIVPIIEKRLAETMEQERLNQEKSTTR